MSVTADYVPTDLPSVPTRYTEPRAHELRDRYLATYGGDQIPVPVMRASNGHFTNGARSSGDCGAKRRFKSF